MSVEEGMPQGPISTEDRAYLERRAEAHLELAALSTNVRVVRAHYTLATCISIVFTPRAKPPNRDRSSTIGIHVDGSSRHGIR